MGTESTYIDGTIEYVLGINNKGTVRYWLVGGAFAIYIMLYLLFFDTFGAVLGAFLLLPLVSATLLFNIKWGLYLLGFAIPLNGTLSTFFGHNFFETIFAEIPGYMISVFVVVATGTIVRFYARYKNAAEQLEEEVAKRKDQEVLLREANHRFKNNLGLISGMMEMNRMETDDKTIKDILAQNITRIDSIAKLHDQISWSDQEGYVNLNDSIQELCNSMADAFQEDKEISVELDTEDVWVDIRDASSYALLLNELMTNAYKHAFPQQAKGRIQVILKKENNLLKLQVSDNGRGLPTDFDLEEMAENTLGMMLVQQLADQLDGILSIENIDGVTFRLQKEM